MNIGLIVAICIGLLLLIVIIWAISVYNKVRIANIKCDEALSGIDVALTKRHDALTKMLGAAKQYVSHEKETILKSIELRQGSSLEHKMEQSKKMDELKNYFVGLAENYPNLKASENYAILQQGIADTEEHLQAARRAYNACVTQYNTLHVTFPSSIIAGKIKPDSRPFFEADETSKQDVVIE